MKRTKPEPATLGIKYSGGLVDDLHAQGCKVHLEQMGGTLACLILDWPNGGQAIFDIQGRNLKITKYEQTEPRSRKGGKK
jgi:hypothetical protein